MTIKMPNDKSIWWAVIAGVLLLHMAHVAACAADQTV